jgi:hypothetical protein
VLSQERCVLRTGQSHLALCVAFGVPRSCIRAAGGLGKTIKQAGITRSTRKSRLSHGVHGKQIMALRTSFLFDFARSAVTSGVNP